MAERIFKERFGNIKKIKVCTTSADIDFDNYTEPGTYEIYEDMGSGQSRVYLLTVDKSVSGACLKQTRIHCGIVDARQTNTAGAWTAWAAVTGGGGGSVDLSNYYTKEETYSKAETDSALNNLDMGISNWVHMTYATKEEIGDIESALDELHTYAQALVNGGAE